MLMSRERERESWLRTLKVALACVVFSFLIVQSSPAVAEITVPNPAVPVPGYLGGYTNPAPGYWAEGFSYINPDASLMIVTEWVRPGGPVYLASKTFNSQQGTWDYNQSRSALKLLGGRGNFLQITQVSPCAHLNSML